MKIKSAGLLQKFTYTHGFGFPLPLISFDINVRKHKSCIFTVCRLIIRIIFIKMTFEFSLCLVRFLLEINDSFHTSLNPYICR
jgi:hypothetical protein